MNRPALRSKLGLSLKSLLVAGTVGVAGLLAPLSAQAAGGGPTPPAQDWVHGGVNSFFSVFKHYDRAALQRGFQIYKEGCSACHSMDLLSYRNLADLGYNEAEIKAIAAQYTVMDGPNDEGEMFERPALPSDRFKNPFPNKKAAAAANNGKAPPDLSLIVKSRKYHEDYIYALLTGYVDPPAGFEVPDGSYYNAYYSGHIIAMAQPLYPDGVTFSDGTAATVEQQAKDVTTFLAWASEPHLEDRRQMGIAVIIFLLFLSAFLYAAKRRLWADVH
ncbi:MAG: hypothetical protein RLY86_723 [Pseudomonadota bacterium]|jgi:ubiquinol-cytochrome c reductase cytochrome c1 subunit